MLLPQPDGPINEISSRRPISRLTSWSARTTSADPGWPNTIETPRIEIAAPGWVSVPVVTSVVVAVIGLPGGVAGPV